MSRNENKNVTSEANSVPAALEVEANQGVRITGKAFKLVDAGVIQAVDGGDQGGKEAVLTPVMVERSVLAPVEGVIHSIRGRRGSSRKARKYENTRGKTWRSESMVDRRVGYQGLKPMAINRSPVGARCLDGDRAGARGLRTCVPSEPRSEPCVVTGLSRDPYSGGDLTAPSGRNPNGATSRRARKGRDRRLR
jgi:hypothetical protein